MALAYQPAGRNVRGSAGNRFPVYGTLGNRDVLSCLEVWVPSGRATIEVRGSDQAGDCFIYDRGLAHSLSDKVFIVLKSPKWSRGLWVNFLTR